MLPCLKTSKGYKDGLQPETLADGNWLVRQNQPVSKIETKSDTNLRSVWVLIQECIDLKISDTVMKSQERNKFRARRSKCTQSLKHSSKRSLYLMRSSHTSAHLQKKSTCFSSWTSPHSHLSQMLELPCHLQDSTLKWCARNLNLLKFLNTLSKSLYK
jgi:hypothetical protein